jgi:hypothetical protein
MITLPDYKVMGGDGHEYGPVSAEQIRQWILEERLERKSPVKPSEAKDWVFLESLPEFADFFQSSAAPPEQQWRKWPVVIVIVLLVLLAGLVVVVLNKFNHH